MPVAAIELDVFATEAERKKLLSRLARVEGQLRGVQKMIESGKDCELVAQQLSAARGALNKAFYELIACAFRTKLGSGCTPEIQERLSDMAGLLAKYA
jgi:DNA-binding FrmR family transcriptional regulator